MDFKSRISKSAGTSGRHYKKIEINTCISDVIPLVRELNKIYDQDEESLNISVSAVLDFESALKNKLDYRFSEIDKNVLFQVTTFLDPQYKGKFFSDILIKEIKEKLLTTLEIEENLTAAISTGVKPITVRKEHCQSLEESIANMLKYWQINSKKFEGLSHITCTYLSSSATSVPK